jgi:hypothetical protein
MYSTRIVAVVGLCGALGCKPSEQKAPTPQQLGSSDNTPSRMVGVYPKLFTCDSLITTAELANLVGPGTVRVVDSALRPPNGLAAPCTYLLDHGLDGGQPSAWTFDIDCRDGAKQTADKLFEQYRSTSADLMQQYNAAADAGQIVANDAGVVPTAPQGVLEVSVGARAIDHHGQALLFWDNDAPCYVRIIGADPSGRLALGKHLADRLTPKTAPMTPRLPENP